MKKKIVLFVLLTFLFSTLCLYAAPRSAGENKQELQSRINALEVILATMKRSNQDRTDLYKKTANALEDLKKQYKELEDAVAAVCDGWWDDDVSLSASLIRKIDNLCKVADGFIN